MPPRPFRRDTEHAVLGGVAAGLGDYFDVDPLLVRLGIVLLVFANGLGLLFYVVCWLLVPAGGAGAARSPAEQAAPGRKIVDEVREAGEHVAGSFRDAAHRAGGARSAVGFLLIGLGSLLLAEELDLFRWLSWPRWASLDTLWPIAIIALGVSVILRSGRERGTKST
jgi:phage shock protein PspC (stress-responsive transcriptional regulator)